MTRVCVRCLSRCAPLRGWPQQGQALRYWQAQQGLAGMGGMAGAPSMPLGMLPPPQGMDPAFYRTGSGLSAASSMGGLVMGMPSPGPMQGMGPGGPYGMQQVMQPGEGARTRPTC